jgi:hypothetical protein
LRVVGLRQEELALLWCYGITWVKNITRGKNKKSTSKKSVDGRCTSSHENKTFRSRSVVKQKGMVFGFRKTATGVVGPEIDI